MRDHPKGGVAPFGYPRIKGCSPLPAAFRSVPRPSSPLSAKASTRCPYLTLDRETSRTGTSPEHDAPRRHSDDHDPLVANMANRIEVVPRSHKNLFTMTINTGCPNLNSRQPNSGSSRSRRQGWPCLAKRAARSKMVEANGIEPMTSCLQSRRSPS